jgi:hypothetical protein
MVRLKALTVQQPWGWAITSGLLSYAMEPFLPEQRGYFLLHSGMGWSFELEMELAERGIIVPGAPPRYRLLAYARLASASSGKQGRFRLNLVDVTPLKTSPILIGRRGFWIVPRGTLALLDLPAHVLSQPLA